MCLLHGLMAELSVKTYIVKVLLCDLVNNSLTPTGGKNNNKISILLQLDILLHFYFELFDLKFIESSACNIWKILL